MRNLSFFWQESEEEEDPEKPSPGKPKSGMNDYIYYIAIEVAPIEMP